MELRKKTKAPKRYDDVEFQRESQPNLKRPPPKATLMRPAFQAKIIEFNPDLPPAAFPTTDSWLPTKVLEDSSHNSSCQNQNQNQNQNQDQNEDQNQNQSLKPQKITCRPEFKTPQGAKKELIVPQQPTIPLANIKHDNESNMACPSSYIRQFFRTPTRSFEYGQPEELEEGRRSNNPGNPVYESNMKIMENLSARTDEDWVVAELETSDEEEPHDGLVHQWQETDTPCWEHLSIAHQVDLVNTMFEICETTTDAMQLLKLNPAQIQTVIELLRQRGEVETKEKDDLKKLQDHANHILLTEDANGARHMSQGRYRELLEEHLYGSSHDQPFFFSTKEELTKAKLYLQACGQDPELLNHWSKFFVGGDKSACIQLDQPKRGLFHPTRCNVPGIQVSKVPESISLQTNQPSVNLAATKQSQVGRCKPLRREKPSLLKEISTRSAESLVNPNSTSNKEANPEATVRETLNLLPGIGEAANTPSCQLPSSLPTPPMTAKPINVDGSGFRAPIAPMKLPILPTPQTPNFNDSLQTSLDDQFSVQEESDTLFQTPLDLAQLPLNKCASIQAPLEESALVKAPLKMPVGTQTQPKKCFSIPVPFDKNPVAKASDDNWLSIQAPLNKPVRTHTTADKSASVQASIDKIPLTKSSIGRPGATLTPLDQPASVQTPKVQTPLKKPLSAVLVVPNRNTTPPSKPPPKARDRRKAVEKTVLVPPDAPPPMIVKSKRKSRSKRAIAVEVAAATAAAEAAAAGPGGDKKTR